jgi:hypothetical protein
MKNIYDIIGYSKENDPYISSFIDYYLEDKSNYKSASIEYVDQDADFLIGSSGGILMKMDFMFINTKVFSEVADHFDKYGRYCDYKKDSEEYNKFWKRETERRRKGMISNCKLLIKDIPLYFNDNIKQELKDLLLKPLRITGTHYNYLNYSRIDRTRNEKERKIAIEKGINPNKTIEGFPRFWDGSYWKSKIDEFSLNNGFNNCNSKARRKGYSFDESGDSANEINLNKNTYIIHAAFDSDKYLIRKGALTYLTKRNLDWYENNTYWRRGYVKEELDNIITGYKIRTEGNKSFGFQSSLVSVSLQKNTSAAAGQTSSRIKFEESGVNAVLQQALDITLSTTEVGANRVGNIRIFGTGGTKDANWVDFKNIYYAPNAYGMLAMENIWDRNSRDKVCGFFFPQIWNYEPYIDEHGNSKLIDAYYIDKEDKEKAKSKKGEDYLIYVGQRANSPEEAFLTTVENIFTSPELIDHTKFINFSDDITYKDGLVINDGKRYVFKSNDDLKLEGNKIHPFITSVPFKPTEDIRGCIRMYERPFRNREGDVPEDIYFAAYDTVKVDKKQGEVTSKHSLDSFQIYEKPNSYTKNTTYRIVAEYCGRYPTMEECDKLMLACCEYWNMKVLFEYGTGETRRNFKTWGKLDRLLKDPTTKLDENSTKKDIGYGIIIGDGEKKLNGLTYLRDWLYTPIFTKEDGEIKYNLHYIKSLPYLLELQNFDLKGNFDRISTGIIAIYYIKSLVLKKENDINNNKLNKQSLSELLNSFSI